MAALNIEPPSASFPATGGNSKHSIVSLSDSRLAFKVSSPLSLQELSGQILEQQRLPRQPRLRLPRAEGQRRARDHPHLGTGEAGQARRAVGRGARRGAGPEGALRRRRPGGRDHPPAEGRMNPANKDASVTVP